MKGVSFVGAVMALLDPLQLDRHDGLGDLCSCDTVMLNGLRNCESSLGSGLS